MRAIILAAGIARRMLPLSEHRHKALLPIGDTTVLGRIIDGLLELEVRDIAIVTGHRADELRAFVSGRNPALPIRWIHNPRYAETNNIVSLSLALEQLPSDEDIILIESDLLFDAGLLKSLLLPGDDNLALVDRYRPGMDGTVVSVSGNYIAGVFPPHLQGADFRHDDKFKTLNIYRFNRDFVEKRFRPLLSCYANLIDGNVYYELVLGMLVNMQRERIRAVVVEEKWAEIDDPNDFASARFVFEPQQRLKILQRGSGGYWNFDVLDFAYLRNMHFPTDGMLAALRQALPQLLRNYGSSQEVLDEKLSWHLRCTPGRAVALHGASQIYPWLPSLLQSDEMLAPWPTFGEYKRIFPRQQRYADAPGVDLSLLESSQSQTIVFVNPNNPTGTTLSSRWIYGFASQRPHQTIIVDESFIDFCEEPSMVSLLEEQPLENVLVVKSLSKTLGVPGIRLGYAYSCSTSMTKRIREQVPIWNLGAPAEFYLELLLKFRPELAASLARTAQDRDDLLARLRALPEIERVFPSGGDFLLARLRVEAPTLVSRLLEKHRIYVKDVSDRFASGSWVRFAVRLPAEHARLCAAISEVMR
jgi:histidinol-phosphate/aromatic aminotransferase/cobyric acid decarboxylase-like protein/choline kinase